MAALMSVSVLAGCARVARVEFDGAPAVLRGTSTAGARFKTAHGGAQLDVCGGISHQLETYEPTPLAQLDFRLRPTATAVFYGRGEWEPETDFWVALVGAEVEF